MVVVGAFLFGMVIGWFTYFTNRYREKVQLADVTVIAAAIGGGAILNLFPEQSVLFGYYGLGLAVGFFGYFLLLLVILRINRGRGWTSEWLLDGRRPTLVKDRQMLTDGSRPMGSGRPDPSL